MKYDQSLLCTLSALVCCVLHLTDAAKEPRKLNWHHAANQSENTGLNYRWISPSKQGYTATLNQTVDTDQPEDLPNPNINPKFHEVLPILQDLSQEEIKSLFSLVSSKENSKPDQALKSKKIVNLLDGNKSLLRSLHYELTSLPRNSTRNYRIQELTSVLRRLRQRAPTVRRMAQVAPEEETVEEKSIGIAEDVIDPRAINDGLMQGFSLPSVLSKSRRRNKRSTKLVHKLIRISPPNVTEVPLLRENPLVDLKLNTTSFVGPSPKTNREPEYFSYNTTMSYQQIEDLAFADLNGTEVELNANNTDDEQLPSPEELVAGPRYRTSTKHRTTYIKPDIKRKRIPIRSYSSPVLQKKCERFTASMCIKADDYPMDQIMGSIRRHKNAMSALLAEYHDKAAELEYQEQLEEYQFNSKRREDGNVVTPGGMCASVIRYARPQKARSASGEWKYIVNTGRHTQTLRLEKCSTPQESCSYLSHNYRSRCTQVYNYHRLLSWDQSRGLHVDIFKVPTCCSCQVDGYRETFPPLGGSKLKEYKDYTPVPNNNPYSSMNDDIDYEDEDSDDMPFPYQFSGALKRNKHDNYHHSELLLGSTNINTKVNPPRLNPTVGSYLSPPTDLYDSEVSSKSVRPPYFTHSSKTQNGRSRKPFKHFVPNESRVDLEISGSEQSDKEVRVYDSTRAHQKRTRVYPGPSNIETPYQTSRPIVASDPVTSFIPATELTTRQTGQSGNTNSNNRKEPTGNGKRINYNYHPIIDFFENHQKSGKAQIMGRNNPSNSIPISSEVITSRDRRIGYSGLENNWHPMVLNN